MMKVRLLNSHQQSLMFEGKTGVEFLRVIMEEDYLCQGCREASWNGLAQLEGRIVRQETGETQLSKHWLFLCIQR